MMDGQDSPREATWDDDDGPRGQWIETCGCGASTRVVDQAFVTVGGKADCPGGHPSSWNDDDRHPSVPMEAGWCGCGEPEDVDEAMLAFLEWRADTARAWDDAPGLTQREALILGYVADTLGWTEHGGSIGGAWLTDEGRTALDNLRARAALSDGSDG